MYTPIVVVKGRDNVLTIGLGEDVSEDTFTSEIRVAEDPESALIAEWVVSFKTDGTDGELVLSLSAIATAEIQHKTGWMDIKRVSTGGKVPPVFEGALPVVFKSTVTA